jgi:hypothetical protein
MAWKVEFQKDAVVKVVMVRIGHRREVYKL